MAGKTVLSAGYSGRALAQSARRAGYVPLVVDGYGDDDTRAAAGEVICLPAFVTTGITAKALLGALQELSDRAASPPIGLVLGAGLEDKPELMRALEGAYTLLGNSAEVTEHCKDPEVFSQKLTELGIAHPEISLSRPANPEGWLVKKRGGSGGRHIREAHDAAAPTRGDYFQRKKNGAAISVFGVVSPYGDVFAFSRQWTAPSKASPFRYGGASGPLTLDEDLEAWLIDTSIGAARALNLVGLVSFDFLIEDGETPQLIEINARPGATLDVFDDAAGTLFKAHVVAVTGSANPAELIQREWQPPAARAVAYLYAGDAPVEIGQVTWPDWVMDRPAAGTTIRSHEPVATVRADADTPDAAEQLCAERMGQLKTMLYDKNQNSKELPA